MGKATPGCAHRPIELLSAMRLYIFGPCRTSLRNYLLVGVRSHSGFGKKSDEGGERRWRVSFSLGSPVGHRSNSFEKNSMICSPGSSATHIALQQVGCRVGR